MWTHACGRLRQLPPTCLQDLLAADITGERIVWVSSLLVEVTNQFVGSEDLGCVLLGTLWLAAIIRGIISKKRAGTELVVPWGRRATSSRSAPTMSVKKLPAP